MRPRGRVPALLDSAGMLLGVALFLVALPFVLVVVTVRDGWQFVFASRKPAKAGRAKRGSSGCLIA